MGVLDWGVAGQELEGEFPGVCGVAETQGVAEPRGVAGKNSCLWSSQVCGGAEARQGLGEVA